MTSHQDPNTQNLLDNRTEDPERDQKLMNESRIHELDKQLFTCRMELYYVWLVIYAMFLISQGRASLEPEDIKPSNNSLIVVYSLYVKNIADCLAFCGSTLVFGGVYRRSLKSINFVILAFKIHFVVNIAFYVVATIFVAKGFIGLAFLFGGIAFLNLLPVIHVKKILEKREALFPYSSLAGPSN